MTIERCEPSSDKFIDRGTRGCHNGPSVAVLLYESRSADVQAMSLADPVYLELFARVSSHIW